MGLIGISLIIATAICFCFYSSAWKNMSLPVFSWLRGPQKTSTPQPSQLATAGPSKEQAQSITNEQINTMVHAQDANGHDIPPMTTDMSPSAETKRDQAAMLPPPIIRMNIGEGDERDDNEEEDDEPTTPKAASFNVRAEAVPSILQASADSESDDEPTSPEMPPPIFPAPFSAQRAGGGLGVASAAASARSSARPSGGGLMAPPPRPGPQQRLREHPTLSANSVNHLSPSPAPYGRRNNLPLPNRGLPPGVASRTPASTGAGSLALPPSTTSKVPRHSRKKIMLTPGHSPLDWAYLTNDANANLRNLPPDAPYLLRVTPSQLKTMNGRKGRDAWTVLGGFVYNISPYLPFHPGGEGELLRCAGKDGNKLFNEVHSWVNYDNMLGACRIGILVEEHASTASPMEEMD